MQPLRSSQENLFDKIQSLPPEKVAVVEDFVDFLSNRDNDYLLKKAVGKLAEASFREVWDNPDDAEYDSL